jgi:hypothetical protein
MEDGFTILANKQIFEKKESNQRVFAFSSFRFHEAILKNLIENHTNPVYLDVILSFKKEISVLLYGHIDLIMADKNYYERTIEGLFSDLDLGKYKYPSQRKRLLEPALEELEGVELTTGILNYAKLEKTVDGKDWKVVFKKSRKGLKIAYKEKQENKNNEASLAIELFNKRFPQEKGMLKEDVIESLIKEYSFDKVMLHISRISNDGEINNPVGLLRASLEKEWDLPPTQEEIQLQEKQVRDGKEKRESEGQEREKDRCLREKEEEERLTKIFFNLPKEEQESLKEEARRLIIEQHIDNTQDKISEFFLRDVLVMIKVIEILREERV